ncbi:hypothetical protein [Amycolatopsis arida]|uniref:hypothetical protein n=1 Tax=Amycolatopsis arida TaxID=587909 RepID=UPI000B805CC3|nr:hypothetical protein [Amycolatopsis arida]
MLAVLLAITLGTGTAGKPADAEEGSLVRQAAASENPPHLVEDFSYPGAERILAERGVKLIKGNGQLLLVDCGPAGLIEVLSNDVSKICFDYIGPDDATSVGSSKDPDPVAWLTMEIPSVFLIKASDRSSRARLTTPEGTKTYYLESGKWNSVGEGADPDGGPQALLRISVY